MAGTNGLAKFVKCNREDEQIFSKSRGATINAGGLSPNGLYALFSSALGGNITTPDILSGGLDFIAPAAGVYTFPTGTVFENYLETHGLAMLSPGQNMKIHFSNTTAAPITISLPAGFTAVDGSTAITVEPGMAFEALIAKSGDETYTVAPLGYTSTAAALITQQVAYDNSQALGDNPVISIANTYAFTKDLQATTSAEIERHTYNGGALIMDQLAKTLAGPTSKRIPPWSDDSFCYGLFVRPGTIPLNFGANCFAVNAVPIGDAGGVSQARGSSFLSRCMESEAGAALATQGIINMQALSPVFDTATNRNQNSSDGVQVINGRFLFFGHYDNFIGTNRLVDNLPAVWDGGAGSALPRLGPAWYSLPSTPPVQTNWSTSATDIWYTLGTFRIINPAGAAGSSNSTVNLLAGLSSGGGLGYRHCSTLIFEIQAHQLGNNAAAVPNGTGTANVWHGTFKLTFTPGSTFVVTQIHQHTTSPSGNLFTVATAANDGEVLITNAANAAAPATENGRVVEYFTMVRRETNITKL